MKGYEGEERRWRRCVREGENARVENTTRKGER